MHFLKIFVAFFVFEYVIYLLEINVIYLLEINHTVNRNKSTGRPKVNILLLYVGGSYSNL